ncbi:MAG: sigma-70 family RNA polymerase sigma factor [Acidobacteriota bacterium]
MADSNEFVRKEKDENITRLLLELRAGDSNALARLMPRVYGELRRLAAHYMQQERKDHTLQPTALVNEAYLRLVGQADRNWQNRGHFFAVAAQAMRGVLVDYARANLAQKRRGGQIRIELNDAELQLGLPDPQYFLALDDLLTRLEGIDLRASRVVELRWFVGHSVEETAQVLGVSEKTVRRDWNFAKAWLQAELDSKR